MTGRPTSVFIVEDEALIAMELEDRLVGLGYTVCGHAARGETGLQQLQDSGADVVLMDIRLAGALNGIETALRLRDRSDVAVIFLTAYSDDALVHDAGTAGPYGYLVKPFDARQIHTTIQVALHRRRLACRRELGGRCPSRAGNKF